MVIVVEIEDRCDVKPFLGGWRNVVTGAEYHDGCTQTCPGDRVCPRSNEDHGDTPHGRVVRTANVITQTPANENARERSYVVSSSSCCKYTSVSTTRTTQTSRLPDLGDKLVNPWAATGMRNNATRRSQCHEASPVSFNGVQPQRRHGGDTDHEEQRFSRLQHECAAKIQKCYRAYRTRLHIVALARLSRDTRAQTPPKFEKVKRLRNCRPTQFEIINPSPPHKRSDFEMLENVLGRWRRYENDRIDRNFFGTSKIAARATALSREIEILRSIETLKTRVRVDKLQIQYLAHLEKIARPEIWKISSGGNIFVETLRVQRARRCRDFYEKLMIEDDETNNVRIDILTNLKNYAMEHTCNLSRDLSSLIDQELELIRRSVDPKLLCSLRNRLKLVLLRLSLNFCDSAKSSNDRDNHHDEKFDELTKTICPKICNRCGKFFHLDDVPKFGKKRGFVFCANCEDRRSCKDPKIVYEPYEIMLRELRTREASLAVEQVATSSSSSLSGSPAFAVDSRVIYRLVNHVWHGKSGISECDDLFRLQLVRFRAELEWSPWNNLVLTKREAALHRAMNDPCLVYSSSLVKKFVLKNLQAKLRFDFSTK